MLEPDIKGSLGSRNSTKNKSEKINIKNYIGTFSNVLKDIMCIKAEGEEKNRM